MKISNIILPAIIFSGLILLGLNNIGIGQDAGQTLRASIGSILTVGGAIVMVAKQLFFTRQS
jgi:hypothetical protein